MSVFDNTKTVTFDEKVYDKILQINSQEGETVTLDDPVLAQGNVETWLAALLKMTKRSVHGIIRSAATAIQEQAFKLLEFENTFPAQVHLNSRAHCCEFWMPLQVSKNDTAVMQCSRPPQIKRKLEKNC